MDFGTAPVSAFAPPLPLDAFDPIPYDEDSQQLLTPPKVISPEWAASAIRILVAAFHRFALAHHTYMQKTSQDRLNRQGTPTSFQLNDRVNIYVPPAHTQLTCTGRRAKHIVAWRGPCRITQILSPVTYEMVEECSNRTFQRTLVNIRPFRASHAPPPPTMTCSLWLPSILEPLLLSVARKSSKPPSI
jgi:hypothetical protein